MGRRQILVELTDDLIALLDERAARTGRSRSELIRSAIERGLAAGRDAAIDAAIVEGYQLLPQPEHDPWAEASTKRSVGGEAW